MQYLTKQLQQAYTEDPTPAAVETAYRGYEDALMGEIHSATTLQDYIAVERLINDFHSMRETYHQFIREIPVLSHKQQLEEQFQREEEASGRAKAQQEKEQEAARKAAEEKTRADALEKQRVEQEQRAKELERLRLESEAQELKDIEAERQREVDAAAERIRAEAERRQQEENARLQRQRDAETKRILDQQELNELRVSVRNMASEKQADTAEINDLKRRLNSMQETLRNTACENAVLRDKLQHTEKRLLRHQVMPQEKPENIVTIESALLPGFSLIQVFNFESRQITSVVMKDRTQDVTSITIHPFKDAERKQLRQAFDLHRKNGGQTEEPETQTQKIEFSDETPLVIKKGVLTDEPLWPIGKAFGQGNA